MGRRHPEHQGPAGCGASRGGADDEALKAAAKELGTTTKRDTINTALREITALYRRLAALEDARQSVADGAWSRVDET